MAGLGGLERRLGVSRSRSSPIRITSGSLAQHALESLAERVGVDPDLALVDDAQLVVVQELDRVLDRDDVLPARAVDVAKHRGERGRFPDACCPGDEDQPAMLVGRVSTPGGRRRLLKFGTTRDDAEGQRITPRWRNTLTRKRGGRQAGRRCPAHRCARTLRAEPVMRRPPDSRRPPARARRRGRSRSGSSSPSKRTIGGRPVLRWTSLAPRSGSARIARRSTWSAGADGMREGLSVMAIRLPKFRGGSSLGTRGRGCPRPRGEEDRREGRDVRLPGVDRVVDADHWALHPRGRVDADVLVGDKPALEVGALDVDALVGHHVVRLVLGRVVAAVAVGDDDGAPTFGPRLPGGVAVGAVAVAGRLHAHQRVLHHESARRDQRALAEVRGLRRAPLVIVALPSRNTVPALSASSCCCSTVALSSCTKYETLG